MSSAFFRHGWPRLGLLAVVAAIMWMTATNRWTATDWATPASYHVDALETLARFQLSAEHGATFTWSPNAKRLGAPWGADWSAYPMPDAPWYWLAGRLVNPLGLIPASNAMLLLAHVLAVLAYYACARALRHRVVFAAGAALLFGFSYSIFHRGLSHHSFALAYTVPLAFLVTWWIGGGRQLWQRRSTWIAAGVIAALIGTASPYFVFLFLQLVALALLYQGFTHRHRPSLLGGGFTLAVCLLAFVTVNFPALLATFGNDPATAITRNYAGTEIYGLKPIELLIPPSTHRCSVAAELGRTYAGATHLRGELFTSYLGLIGLLAMGLMLAGFGRRLLLQRAGLRPAHAPLSLWIVLLAMVGGLNALFALAGLDHFRAGNRYSIHLLALALFFLSGWATVHLRHWSNLKAWLATLLLVGIGLWDQAPPPPSSAHQDSLRRLSAADRAAGIQLANLLSADAKVFLLPATVFPEGGPRHNMGDYEHLRLFLGTNSLQFSYGALTGLPTRFWAEHVSSLSPTTLVASLEQAGFAALLIDRRAYADEATGLTHSLAVAGYPATKLDARPELTLVVLKPVAQPALPDLSVLKIRPYWNAADAPGAISLHAQSGWFDLEMQAGNSWRWAGRRAVLGLWNDTDSDQPVMLTGRVQPASAGRLLLTFNGLNVREFKLHRAAVELGGLQLTLPPGPSRLEWHFDGRLVRPPGDPRALGFQVENLGVHTTR